MAGCPSRRRQRSSSPHPVKIGFLAFGVAALLYLVVEELLLEAHHLRHRTSLAAATFFLGFLIILLADGAGWQCEGASSVPISSVPINSVLRVAA